MPGLEQLWWCRREDAHADFSGQGGKGLQPGRSENREERRRRDSQWNVVSPVLGLLARTAIAAILGRMVRVCGGHRTTQKFQTGHGFQLAMCRSRQPEEGCQGKNDVLETPHADIDNADI